jgi:hypothetical protein
VGWRGLASSLAVVGVVVTLGLAAAPPPGTYTNPLTPLDTPDPHVATRHRRYICRNSTTGRPWHSERTPMSWHSDALALGCDGAMALGCDGAMALRCDSAMARRGGSRA